MPNLVTQVKNQLLKNIYMMSFLRNSAEASYHHALRHHARKLPLISKSERAIIQKLHLEGVFVTSLNALGISSSPSMIADAQLLIPRLAEVIPDANEYVVHATDEQILNNPSIFMWGLETQILNIAENYLGLPVAYHGAYFRRDIKNLVERKSRCWHIDREDRRMFKVIIYLHDVDEAGGAFQYIEPATSAELSQKLNYKYGYIRDRQMQKFIAPSEYKSCTGAAGTVVIADTGRVFHRGKIPTSSDRFALFYDYTSYQPQYPFYCKSSLPETYLAKLAMNMSESQKKCVFWRDGIVN